MPTPEDSRKSGAPTANDASPRNAARRSLLEAMDPESSVDQTLSSAYNSGEARRLLESSGIASGGGFKAASFCNHSDCNYQLGHCHDCIQRGLSARFPRHRQEIGTNTNTDNDTEQQITHEPMIALHQPEQIGYMHMEAQTIRLYPAYFIAEMLGTFLLVFIGDGATATFVFNNRPIDTFTVCLAFGVGAMIATYVCAKVSGAHLNPAATVAFAVVKKLKWELVPVYVTAQYAGGFLAALLLFFNYSEAINAMDGGDHKTYGVVNATGSIFATYPAPYVSVWGSIIDQVFGTSMLLFSLMALSDTNNLALEERFQPPIVAFAVGLVCFAFSVNCGAIFNPARDLSPRLLTALLGYPHVWEPIGGTYWYVAGIIGPHIGAILGVYGYKYLIGTALHASEQNLKMVRERVAAAGFASGTSLKSMETKPAKFVWSNPLHRHTHDDQNQQHYHDMAAATTPVQQRPVDVPDYGSSVKR